MGSGDSPLLLSVPEAAQLLGVGRTFGWELARSGQLPTIRLGRRVLVPRAALERLAGLGEAQ
jgi:excisionase family DNA binding protein